MSEATPAERVDELTNDDCANILLRIVEIVDAHTGGGGYLKQASAVQAADLIADTLRDWSLID